MTISLAKNSVMSSVPYCNYHDYVYQYTIYDSEGKPMYKVYRCYRCGHVYYGS